MLLIVCTIGFVVLSLKKELDGKCEFVKTCDCYDVSSNSCNNDRGRYYADGWCGKYRKNKGWD